VCARADWIRNKFFIDQQFEQPKAAHPYDFTSHGLLYNSHRKLIGRAYPITQLPWNKPFVLNHFQSSRLRKGNARHWLMERAICAALQS
jgi:hypothetical protein